MVGRASLLVITLVAAPAHADGWSCEAAGTWQRCATPGSCTTERVATAVSRADRVGAELAAVEACRVQVSAGRLSASWTPGATAPSTDVADACAVTRCDLDPNFTPDPTTDAFDGPVCIGVRDYICTLCGVTSSLCERVKRERPVTELACADTWVELEAFGTVLDTFEAMQPGSKAGALLELCGPALTPGEAPPPVPAPG